MVADIWLPDGGIVRRYFLEDWIPDQVRNDKLNKTSAIQKAQKDIKKKARGDNRVDSMEEWFRYNLSVDTVGN